MFIAFAENWGGGAGAPSLCTKACLQGREGELPHPHSAAAPPCPGLNRRKGGAGTGFRQCSSSLPPNIYRDR